MANKSTAHRLAEQAQFERMCERASEFLGKIVVLEDLEERFELDPSFGSNLEPHIHQRLRRLRVALRINPYYGIPSPCVSDRNLANHTRHLPEVERKVARTLPKLERSHWVCYLSDEFPSDEVSAPVRRKPKKDPKHAQQRARDSNKQDSVRIAAFYKSYDWKRARYEALLRAKGRCMCCKRDDAPLNVDHIKPVKKHWSLRLDPNNLQVLCGDCNHGKGNWDETDWRGEEVAVSTALLHDKRKELQARMSLIRTKLLPR